MSCPTNGKVHQVRRGKSAGRVRNERGGRGACSDAKLKLAPHSGPPPHPLTAWGGSQATKPRSWFISLSHSLLLLLCLSVLVWRRSAEKGFLGGACRPRPPPEGSGQPRTSSCLDPQPSVADHHRCGAARAHTWHAPRVVQTANQAHHAPLWTAQTLSKHPDHA